MRPCLKTKNLSTEPDPPMWIVWVWEKGGCQEPFPEGGRCEVQIGTPEMTVSQLKLDYIKGLLAGREIKAPAQPSSGTCLPARATSLVTYQSPGWPPDSFGPCSHVLVMHFKVLTPFLPLPPPQTPCPQASLPTATLPPYNIHDFSTPCLFSPGHGQSAVCVCACV